MKGLLHRLAAQATGVAVPVHSDARLPFANVELHESGPVENSGPQESAAPSDVLAARMEPGSEAQSHPPTTPPLVKAWTHRKSNATPELASDSTTPNHNTHRLPRDPAPEGIAVARRTALTQVHARTGEAAAAPRQPATADASIAPAIAPAMREILAAEPSLLLPTQPVARSSSVAATRPQNIRSAKPSNASSGAATGEEPHEVHIHIGRIDVTAVHEAPAPRRGTAATTAPMTLDNYFAKRGRT